MRKIEQEIKMAGKPRFGNRTYFGEPAPKYKAVTSDDIIETVPFLDAASLIPPFFDILGPTMFMMIKNDIQGNIDKIHSKYTTNPEKFTTINSILEEEFETKSSTNGQIGALWLKRGLHFIQVFLSFVLENGRTEKSENIQQFLLKSYKMILMQHHAWVFQKVIIQLTKACPSRTTLMEKLRMNPEITDDEVYNDIDSHMQTMKPMVDLLDKILKDYKLETTNPQPVTEKPLLLYRLLFPICTLTYRTAHTMAFDEPVVDHWLIDQPWYNKGYSS